MKLRNIALGLYLCAPLGWISYSQEIPKERQQRLVTIAQQLHLSHKQAMQLFPIMKAEEPQLQAIRNNASLSKEEKFERLQAVHDASGPRVKAILTPQQYAQFQVIREQRRAQLLETAKSSAQKNNPHQGYAARSKEKPKQK